MKNALNNKLALLAKVNYILSKPEKRKLILLSLGSVMLSLMEVFSIGLIIPIMVLFANAEKFQTGRTFKILYQLTRSHDLKEFFFILVAGAVILFVFKAAYGIFIFASQQYITGKIYTRLTARLMQNYLAKPYSFHLVNNSSLLFKNIVEDISRFTSSFLGPAIIIASEAIIFLGVFLFLLAVYPAVTASIVVVFGMVVLLLNILLIKRIKGYSAIREKNFRRIHVTATEGLSAVKEIQMYDVNKFFTQRFSDAAKGYTGALVKYNIAANLPRPVLETMIFVLFLLGMMVSVLMNKSFSDLMPMMTVIGVVCIRLLSSVSKIYTNAHILLYNSNAVDIVYDILSGNDIGKEKCAVVPGEKHIEEGVPSIQLRGVTFRYESASGPALEDLSLSFPLGRTVAIVGKTGSGKSTLIDILMGLLEPSRGSFYYCGDAVCGDNVADYRRKIGYVPQNFFLIDDSIRANIAFGIYPEDIDHKKLEDAIRIAQLETFISGLPAGADTMVGEKGIRISGGQRQRIALARALYRSPEILVLDEATSALDRRTEEAFYNAVREMEKRLSVILVTHRFSTLEHADRIFVIEAGQLAAQGNLKELLLNSPVFQGMANQKIISDTST